MKKYNKTSPGLRHRLIVNRKLLDKVLKYKSLIKIKKSKSGHNNQGKITVAHKRKGHKKFNIKNIPMLYKYIPYVLNTLEYNSIGTNYLNLISILSLKYCYYPSILGTQRGNIIYTNSILIGKNKIGNSYKLKDIKLNEKISNLYSSYKQKYQVIKAAGSSSEIIRNNSNKLIEILLSSGKLKLFYNNLLAIVGSCGNIYNNKTIKGKAGINFYKGIRPTVRGVAKNPIDHPHGGGEGKSSGGRVSVSKTGVPSKGKKTRKNKKYSNKFIKI